MMLGAGSGIDCLLGVFLGVAVCCQLSGTRACWARPPVSGPLAPAGNYQGPRHLWHGAAALPLCQMCGCSDPSWGAGHVGPVDPNLVPPRVAATWPVPPLYQGPRHLQEGAHVPAWGVFAPSHPPGPYQGPRHLRPPGGSGSEPLVNPGSPAGGGLPGRCGPLPG